jgi:hypothetical protein
VLQGGTIQIHLNHVATCGFQSLLDGSWHFTRLATTKTDTTLAITHHRQRGEGENTTPLHYLGDAIDLNQLLNEAFILLLLKLCHDTNP